MPQPKKKTKLKPGGRWKEYVRYMMETNKGVPLKTLLKNYKKEDYKKFCKKHCVHY
jgi:hypothetical protein